MSKKIKFSGTITFDLKDVEFETDDYKKNTNELVKEYLQNLVDSTEELEISAKSEDVDYDIDECSEVSRDVDFKVRVFDVVVEDEEGKEIHLKEEYEIDTRVYEYDEDKDTLEEAIEYELDSAIPSDTTIKNFKYEVLEEDNF